MRSQELYPMRTDAVQIKGLQDLIEYLKTHLGDLKSKTMIEIGSYAGESSVMFAEHFKLVICIDPFMDDYDPNDLVNGFATMDIVEKRFDENTNNYINIQKIKMTSDDAIDIMLKLNINPNFAVDFVYIDALHTYDQVKKDIENYMPIIVDGGFIGGHDYHPNHPEVMRAVDEKLLSVDASFVDGSFVKQVKN
jgi:cephalosporin hydroxylase